MRSAFIRWCQLHNEEYRIGGYIRRPNWFRYYIRNNCEWNYHITTYYQNCFRRNGIDINVMDKNQRRTYKGFYIFDISDDELLNLQRAEWIKE